MNNSEISLRGCWNAVKHQWKLMLAFILCFAVLGVGAGLLLAPRLSAGAEGGAEKLEYVDFEELDYSPDYYGSRVDALQKAWEDLKSYWASVYGEATLTEQQIQSLEALGEELDDFETRQLQMLRDLVNNPQTFTVPESQMDATIAACKAELQETRLSLLEAAQAVELVKTMQVPAGTTEEALASYTAMMQKAESYGALLKEEAYLEMVLDRLQNEPEQVQSDSQTMEKLLEQSVEEFNALLDETYACVNGIAEANYLAITPVEQNGKLQAAISHTHGAATSQEAFVILTLFCILVGICSGLFFAIYREAKMEQRKKSAGMDQPQ